MQKFITSAPGAVWAALIVGLMLLAEWLTQYFGGEVWVPPLVGFIAAVLVPVLKVIVQGEEPAGQRGLNEQRSAFKRWLL